MLLLLSLLVLTDPLITIEIGELPIVISAPHGGRLQVPDCPIRTNKSLPQFVTVLDTNSDKLAVETAKELEKLTGKKPWLIVAKFSRKYVDANRTEATGTESEAAREVYRRYHAALSAAVQATESDPRALLLDIHAQGASRSTIYRGTGNLASIKNKSLTPFASSGGFLFSLEKEGLKVLPSIEKPDEKENSSFNGGYITRHYGANNPGGVNAIQLEVGESYRSKKTLISTAKSIATAIVWHLEKSK